MGNSWNQINASYSVECFEENKGNKFTKFIICSQKLNGFIKNSLKIKQ